MQFKSFLEIEALVKAFERVEIEPGCWDHRSHLTVACWYLLCYPLQEAVPLMRAGLHRHLEAWGIQTTLERGYHETITVAWMRLVKHYLTTANLECTLVELINDINEKFGHKDHLFEYFTRDRLMSWEARNAWIEPDIKSLPKWRN